MDASDILEEIEGKIQWYESQFRQSPVAILLGPVEYSIMVEQTARGNYQLDIMLDDLKMFPKLSSGVDLLMDKEISKWVSYESEDERHQHTVSASRIPDEWD